MTRRQRNRTGAALALTTLLTLAGTSLAPAQPTVPPTAPAPIANATVVSNFLAAVQRGDRAQVAALLHPNVRWYQPGSNALSGLKPSREAVFAMSARIHEHTARSYRITDISALSTNGSSVAVRLHFSAASPVMVLDVDNIDVFKVQDGLITEVRVHSANLYHENAFWGN
ncbi:nuclear transport factor 2 family protein [Fibrella aestuarina]|uniref:nuclear transport factor 2 family protein n=1 Tax=Fibrella aestuarina TaxID=651143 RepID=UPI0002E6E6D2|nr:nuclear transport factor 2 family protein [Fibrella aestuarina]